MPVGALALTDPPKRTKAVVEKERNTLGKRLRAVRTLRGLSLVEAARAAGIAKQTLWSWETGETPSLDNLRTYAQVMRVPLSDLFSSTDLKPVEPLAGRLGASSRILPVYRLERAGELLMHPTVASKTAPDSHIATIGFHPSGALAFTVEGDANAPRFRPGDVVTVIPQTMAERGALVLAKVGGLEGGFVFRRFLPRVDGTHKGAILRALNEDYPDIIMETGDAILGRMGEHTTAQH